jgi:hypothetical protein
MTCAAAIRFAQRVVADELTDDHKAESTAAANIINRIQRQVDYAFNCGNSQKGHVLETIMAAAEAARAAFNSMLSQTSSTEAERSVQRASEFVDRALEDAQAAGVEFTRLRKFEAHWRIKDMIEARFGAVPEVSDERRCAAEVAYLVSGSRAARQVLGLKRFLVRSREEFYNY